MTNVRSRRVALLRIAAILPFPLLARAQPSTKVYRVGFLAATTADDAFFPLVPDELRRLGFEQGRNVIFEVREAKRQPETVPTLAAALVATKPDVIVTDLPRQILALRRVTDTIPIVMTYGMVPEELGLIQSLRRPGGNVTGTLIGGPEAAGKTFQIVREILPPQARFAMLYERDYPGLESYMRQWEQAAAMTGLRPSRFPVATEPELSMALDQIVQSKIDAMLAAPTGVLARQSESILKLAAERRIAVVAPTRWMVERGALMAFEADLALVLTRAAAITAKILGGANPAEIPVEEPTKYELWLNLKTANTLGLKIPTQVRLQATNIIE